MAMNGLSKMVATALLLVLVIVPAAVAVTYKVGDASQWSTGVDYTDWVTGKTFKVGDVLEFEYGPLHSVDVVDKAGYDGCDSSTATENHSDGDTKIELKTVGPKYYICPTPGHCQGGMKLAITVVAAATPATPSPPSSTPATPATPGTPATPATPSTPRATPTPVSGSTPPPTPKPSGAAKGVMSYVLIGVSMVFGYGLLI